MSEEGDEKVKDYENADGESFGRLSEEEDEYKRLDRSEILGKGI